MKNDASKKAVLKRLFAAAMVLALALTATVAAQEKTKTPTPPAKLSEIRKHLGELQTRIAKTTESLDHLKKGAKDGSDLLASYTKFDNQLKQLESLIEKVRAESTQMRARAGDYYSTWQSELGKLTNPELREKAQNRFQDAKDDFDEIIVAADEAKRSLGPFMADLRDVHTYLAADLSVDSVKSISSTIWRLNSLSMSVIGAVQHLNGEISRTLEQLPEGN